MMFPYLILCLGEAHGRITGTFADVPRWAVGLVLLAGFAISAAAICRWHSVSVIERLLMLVVTVPLMVVCFVVAVVLIVFLFGFEAT
jgi:uncharacterized membrane protein YidH (DUF202 family)